MGERAKVDSIDALKTLRRTLVKFAEAANAALGDAESDVARMLTWLETEQLTRRQTQVRLRTDLVTQAKDKLREKQLYKSPTGGRQSTVDEEKALKIAMRRLEEAEQKLVNVKKYTQRISREQHLFRGSVQRFATCVQVDVPNARAKLDNMIDKLEQYASTAPASEATSQAASAGSMSRGSGDDIALADLIDTLRERTVVARRDVPSAIPLELPPQWGVADLAETDIAVLRRLPREEPPDVGSKILIDVKAATAPRVYLERSIPATDRESDSGWLLAPVETDVTMLHAVPISTLLEVRPDLRDILRLPTWSLVILERDGRLSTIVDGDDRDLRTANRVTAQASE